MNKAVIFARTSSNGALEKRQNTDRQVLDLQDYARLQNYDVVNTFAEHISGVTKNQDREVLQECLTYVVNNNVDMILCSEMSRLSRSVYELQESIKFCVDNHINIYFQKENIYLFDSNGNQSMLFPILVSVLGVVAQIERDSIVFRLNSGRKRAIENGTCTLGRKVGWRKSKEKKEEEYSEVIKLIKKGYSQKAIVDICKARKIKCSLSTIKRVKREFCI